MVRIAVLVSGGGTNLQALIDAQSRGELKNGRIAAVLSSRPDAYALERAARAGIPGYVLPRRDFSDSRGYTAALTRNRHMQQSGRIRNGFGRCSPSSMKTISLISPWMIFPATSISAKASAAGSLRVT